MLKRIPLWITLNFYAFVLDALCASLALTGAGCFSQGYSLFAWIFWVLAGFVATGALKIHLSYPKKYYLFTVLKRRNLKKIRMASFEEFVDVPCHRLIVRTVLAHLNCEACYKEVLKRYYRLPWQRDTFVPGEAIVFNSPDEYNRWKLKQSKQRIV